MRRRNGFAVFLVILAALTMLGVVGVSQAEDCPDQGGRGSDKGVVDPPDTDDKNNGCDDEDTKPRENNGSGNDEDCEDDNNGLALGLLKNGVCGDHPPPPPPGSADLTISKSGVILNDGGRIGFPDEGETIRYTVNFGNSGTAAATSVEVRDVINENLGPNDQPTNYVAGSASSTVGTASFSNGVVTVTVASLDAGQNGVLTFDVSVPAGTFHDCNRATIGSAGTSTETSNTFCFD